jgi:hypothetical protein
MTARPLGAGDRSADPSAGFACHMPLPQYDARLSLNRPLQTQATMIDTVVVSLPIADELEN